jgi:hypothetical protein
MRGDERSPFLLASRIAAAARAGYRGFGIVHAVIRLHAGGLRPTFQSGAHPSAPRSSSGGQLLKSPC